MERAISYVNENFGEGKKAVYRRSMKNFSRKFVCVHLFSAAFLHIHVPKKERGKKHFLYFRSIKLYISPIDTRQFMQISNCQFLHQWENRID